jgi:TonB family protein
MLKMENKILFTTLFICVLLIFSCNERKNQNDVEAVLPEPIMIGFDRSAPIAETTVKDTLANNVPERDITEVVAVVTTNSVPEREKTETASNEDRIYGNADIREISTTAMMLNHIEYFRTNNRFADWDSNDEKRVFVLAIIEKDGTASNIKVGTSSGNEELDNEAVRLIREAEYREARNLNGDIIRMGDFGIPVYFPPRSR